MSCRVLTLKHTCAWKHHQFCNVNFSMSPEVVLSNFNKNNCIKLLERMKPVQGNILKKSKLKNAAVLVPLCKINEQLGFLYTVRPLHLKSNGGEVAFPGGMQEASDLTLKDTALRETFEEVGIAPNNVEIWGKAPEILRPGMLITPYLGYVEAEDINNLKINSNEVSAVFLASLKNLSASDNFRTTHFRLGKSHVYKTPVYLGVDKRIWGLTAVITHTILSALIPNIYNKNIKFDTIYTKILGISQVKSQR